MTNHNKLYIKLPEFLHCQVIYDIILPYIYLRGQDMDDVDSDDVPHEWKTI